MNVHVKVLPSPSPEKFNTFNTFNTLTTFATFGYFTLAREDPTLVDRQAPRARSVSERARSPPHPPLPARWLGCPRRGALWAGREGG